MPHSSRASNASRTETVAVFVLLGARGERVLVAAAHDGVALEMPLPPDIGQPDPGGTAAAAALHRDALLALIGSDADCLPWSDGGWQIRMALCAGGSPADPGLRSLGFGWQSAGVGAAVVGSAPLELIRRTRPPEPRLAMACIVADGDPAAQRLWLSVAFYGAIGSCAAPSVRALQGKEVRGPLPPRIAAMIAGSDGGVPLREVLAPVTAEILHMARSAAVDPANWTASAASRAKAGRPAPRVLLMFSRGHELISLPA